MIHPGSVEETPTALVELADSERREGALVLEAGQHSQARERLFSDRGWLYMSMGPPETGVDERHRLRGVLGDAPFLPSGAFDAVVLVDQVECSRTPWRLAEEVARVLRPGGRAYVEATLRTPEQANSSAPWTLGPAALRSLFSQLQEEDCALLPGGREAAEARIRYVAVKRTSEEESATSPPSIIVEGCPACGGEAKHVSEQHEVHALPLLLCNGCGHASIDPPRRVPARSGQSGERIDFYVRNVVRHLPIASVLDLYPSEDQRLLVAVHEALPGVHTVAFGGNRDDERRIRVVSAVRDVGHVDLAIGLQMLQRLKTRQLRELVAEVTETARWFVFEIPVADDPDRRRPLLKDDSVVQFFTERSVRALFAGTGARVHGMAGFGKRRGPVLVAYRLPDDKIMSNGLVLDLEHAG